MDKKNSVDKAHSGKESRELAQASRNHEVPWIISMRSQPCLFKKAADFRAQKIICGQKEVRVNHRGQVHWLTISGRCTCPCATRCTSI